MYLGDAFSPQRPQHPPPGRLLRSNGTRPKPCGPRSQHSAISAARHTRHILPPSEIDLGLFEADFTDLEGKHLFHRIG